MLDKLLRRLLGRHDDLEECVELEDALCHVARIPSETTPKSATGLDAANSRLTILEQEQYPQAIAEVARDSSSATINRGEAVRKKSARMKSKS